MDDWDLGQFSPDKCLVLFVFFLAFLSSFCSVVGPTVLLREGTTIGQCHCNGVTGVRQCLGG